MQQFWIRYYWTRKVWLLTLSVVDIFIPRTCHLFTESQPSADSNADWWIFCVKDPTTHGTWVKGYPCANECPPQEVPHFRFRWFLYISAQCLFQESHCGFSKKEYRCVNWHQIVILQGCVFKYAGGSYYKRFVIFSHIQATGAAQGWSIPKSIQFNIWILPKNDSIQNYFMKIQFKKLFNSISYQNIQLQNNSIQFSPIGNSIQLMEKYWYWLNHAQSWLSHILGYFYGILWYF